MTINHNKTKQEYSYGQMQLQCWFLFLFMAERRKEGDGQKSSLQLTTETMHMPPQEKLTMEREGQEILKQLLSNLLKASLNIAVYINPSLRVEI